MHYIRARYNVAKGYCEAINRALDLGFMVFNEDNHTLDPQYRFQFQDPSNEELNDHEFIWGDQITLRVSDKLTLMYFSPDDPVSKIHEFFSKWRLIEPANQLTLKTFLKEKP